MPTAVQESFKEEYSTTRNTGFPEPLSPDRNTTLPHPSADTSKNAAIEAPDVPLSRTHSRSRSFLGRKHSGGTHSHKSKHSNGAVHAEGQGTGPISVEESGLYDNIEYADGSKETRGSREIEKAAKANGTTNGEVQNNKQGDQHSVDGVEEERDEHGYREGERKKGVLRKLGLHKV